MLHATQTRVYSQTPRPKTELNQPYYLFLKDNVRFRSQGPATPVETSVPFWKRPLAFLSPDNWKAGWQKAIAVFQSKAKQGKQWQEAVKLMMDLALFPVSLGFNLVLNVFFPGLSFSETYQAFFKGVHEATVKMPEQKADAKTGTGFAPGYKPASNEHSLFSQSMYMFLPDANDLKALKRLRETNLSQVNTWRKANMISRLLKDLQTGMGIQFISSQVGFNAKRQCLASNLTFVHPEYPGHPFNLVFDHDPACQMYLNIPNKAVQYKLLASLAQAGFKEAQTQGTNQTATPNYAELALFDDRGDIQDLKLIVNQPGRFSLGQFDLSVARAQRLNLAFAQFNRALLQQGYKLANIGYNYSPRFNTMEEIHSWDSLKGNTWMDIYYYIAAKEQFVEARIQGPERMARLKDDLKKAGFQYLGKDDPYKLAETTYSPFVYHLQQKGLDVFITDHTDFKKRLLKNKAGN